MTKEDLFEAIGGLDDEVVLSASLEEHKEEAPFRVLKGGQEEEKRQVSPRALRWSAVAACLVVALIGTYFFRDSLFRGMGSAGPSLKNAQKVEEDGISMAYSFQEAQEEAPSEAAEEAILWTTLSSTQEITIGYPGQTAVTLNEEAYREVLDEIEVSMTEEKALITGSYREEGTYGANEAAGTGAEEATPDAADTAPGESALEEALCVLTFDQGGTLMTASLFEDGRLVFDDDPEHPVYLSPETVEKLLQDLQ